MRFRLRTLLMVVTIAAMYCGWVAYMRQMAALHRRQSERFAAHIATVEQFTDDEISSSIQRLASERQEITSRYIEIEGTLEKIGLIENGCSGLVVNDHAVADWHCAIDHAMMADTYARAVLQPWTLIRSTRRLPKD